MKNIYKINDDDSVTIFVKKKDGRELFFEVCKDGFNKIKNINRSFCIKEQHGKQIYVYYSERNLQGKDVQPMLHRILMNDPENMVVDHRDRNPMNNRIDNLRICTHEDNSKNRGMNRKTKAIYKGVRKSKNNIEDTWNLTIKKQRYGTFTNVIAAANAYNYYIKDLDGEFSVINDVEFMKKEEWEKFIVKNTSNHKGIHYCDLKKKWIGQFYHNKKQEYLGQFETEKCAIEAYEKRKLELLS